MGGRRDTRGAVSGLWFSCVLGVVMGCGGGGSDAGLGLVPVSGTVALDGQPLATGTIVFVPAEGGPSSTGKIVDGRYSLKYTRTARGVKPGKYVVAVISWITPPTMKDDGSEVAGQAAVPEKYMAPGTSGLTAEVPADGTDPINFELQAKN